MTKRNKLSRAHLNRLAVAYGLCFAVPFVSTLAMALLLG